jgi:lysophospholipase L1-like esterase
MAFLACLSLAGGAAGRIATVSAKGVPTALLPSYVALGDSYSSGEGNAPFYANSDTASDQCHRSPEAYPALLSAKLTSLNFVFAACSGATTGNVWESGDAPETVATDPEELQINHLTSGTKVVTISIGGNDLGFSNVIKACIEWIGCANAAKYDATVRNIGENITLLEQVLIRTYEKIQAAAPNAQIWVLGYPYAIPPKPTEAQEIGTCATSSGLVDFSLGYLAPFEVRLDGAIAAAAATADSATGAKVHFVNPNVANENYSFLGHDICESTSWFFGLINKKPTLYSFHPTAQGQTALVESLFAAGVQRDA